MHRETYHFETGSEKREGCITCMHLYGCLMIVWVVECGETHQFKRKDRALWAAAMSSVLLLMGSNHIAFITIPMLPPWSF